ncbi:MAG: alpha/beta fold hydrolase [Methanocorpusculum sp.]|nr:alpha/beta fold hydrolase [Methanocorpusculum sp.]
MNKASLPSCELSYTVFGQGRVNLVIEIALGATAGEWWHIAEHLSEKYTVLLYERSKNARVERTPLTIANELHELLKAIPCEEQIIIVAHSQGGLYAQQFARLYPQMVKGVVLIDPLSANDSYYKKVLTPKEQKQSGFDKTGNLVIMKHLSALHLGFVIKAFMKKAPPFYYYHNFSQDAEEYILTAITVPSLYTSSLEEYRLSHMEQYTLPLKDKLDFPDIPLVLITHSSEFSIKEIIEFGRVSSEFAAKVEMLWQSLMKEYLTFSNVNQFIQARNSGHFIHLTEPELIDDGLFWIERNTIK